MAKNLVVYALAANERKPVASYDPNDDVAAVKVAHSIGAVLRDSDSRGVPHPDFAVVVEERTANEQGQQTLARFTRVDPLSLKPAGKTCATLEEAIASKAYSPATAQGVA